MTRNMDFVAVRSLMSPGFSCIPFMITPPFPKNPQNYQFSITTFGFIHLIGYTRKRVSDVFSGLLTFYLKK